MESELWQPREQCTRCFKPKQTCVCDHVQRVDNRTPVLVIQHPRERFHPIGTVRLAALGLARVRVEVAFRDRFVERPAFVSPGAGLLYPTPDALPLEGASLSQLVVIDGTWHHARTLFRDLPWLQTLPRYRLSPSAPSRYRIRREPNAHSMSTIEAIALALRTLEPTTDGIDSLLAAFDHMIDVQIGYIQDGSEPRTQVERRPRSYRRLPRALLEDFHRLVICYAETLQNPSGRYDLAQLVALRAATGERFEGLVRGAVSMDDPRLAHLGIPRDRMASGHTFAELREHWQRFCRKDDIFATWNPGALAALRGAGLVDAGTVIKAAYVRQRELRPGTLDEVMQREGLSPEPLPFAGRSARRLAQAVAAVELLRHLADAA